MYKNINYKIFSGGMTLVLLLLLLSPQLLISQENNKLREPLPIDAVLSLRNINTRSSFYLAPNGEWLAYTVITEDALEVEDESLAYSATGAPYGEGPVRREAYITNVNTGETILLGDAQSSSWSPVFSPDGKRVAFYSDQDGEAGLWIWEMDAKKATRFPGVIVRHFFGFEHVRWTSDSKRILLKILPEGMTIKEANALAGTNDKEKSFFPKVEEGQPSVYVRKFDPDEKKSQHDDASSKASQSDIKDRLLTDIALLDIDTKGINRLIKRVNAGLCTLSPDEKSIAFSRLKGQETSTFQNNFDIVVSPLEGGSSRTITADVRMNYGIAWNWSPDSKTICYVPTGPLATGEVVSVSVADGTSKKFKKSMMPPLGIGHDYYMPYWSKDGKYIYVAASGKLWRVDANTGEFFDIGNIEGWQIKSLVTPFNSPIVYSNDDGKTIYVIARENTGQSSGIYSISTNTGDAKLVLKEKKSYAAHFNADANKTTGDIVFVSTDLKHPKDAWVFNTKTNNLKQVTRTNEKLERYELGNVEIISWVNEDGDSLKGALLLPPGYKAGSRLPLVAWVYGGAMSSMGSNRFGLFMGDLPVFNMHLLATRGYAVLFPDIPVREGKTMKDIVKAVIPGVQTAVDQDFADSTRLAVMGQSYGSYTTLSLITHYTGFKAAVITAAVLHPDLFSGYLESSIDGKAGDRIGFYEHGQGNMGGSIWEYRDRYFDNSPLFLFDKIETPLLIGQGNKDGNLAPSDAIYAALQRLGKYVEYRLYKNEGHAISQKKNVLDFWNRRLEFFAEHLDLVYNDKGNIVFNGKTAAPNSK